MISMDDAESAVDWLRNNAARMAKQRAERLYMEQWIKTVKATLMSSRIFESAAKAEIFAMASQEWKDALMAYRDAIEIDEKNRFLLTAAEAKIEAWRSQESTRRAEGKAYG